MKTILIASAILVSTLPALAAEKKMSDGCKEGIEQDLHRNGYSVISMRLGSRKSGLCDGETCNPDNLKIAVVANTQFDRSVKLVVKAEGPFFRNDWCRVTDIEVAQKR
jgi:hypothetical protein